MLKYFCSTVVLLLASFSATAADISGAWDFSVQTDAGSGNPAFVFKQDGEKLTGTYSGALGDAQLTGTVKENKVQWTFVASEVKVQYSGVIESPTKMKGTVQLGNLGSGSWTATKK